MWITLNSAKRMKGPRVIAEFNNHLSSHAHKAAIWCIVLNMDVHVLESAVLHVGAVGRQKRSTEARPSETFTFSWKIYGGLERSNALESKKTNKKAKNAERHIKQKRSLIKHNRSKKKKKRKKAHKTQQKLFRGDDNVMDQLEVFTCQQHKLLF